MVRWSGKNAKLRATVHILYSPGQYAWSSCTLPILSISFHIAAACFISKASRKLASRSPTRTGKWNFPCNRPRDKMGWGEFCSPTKAWNWMMLGPGHIRMQAVRRLQAQQLPGAPHLQGMIACRLWIAWLRWPSNIFQFPCPGWHITPLYQFLMFLRWQSANQSNLCVKKWSSLWLARPLLVGGQRLHMECNFLVRHIKASVGLRSLSTVCCIGDGNQTVSQWSQCSM